MAVTLHRTAVRRRLSVSDKAAHRQLGLLNVGSVFGVIGEDRGFDGHLLLFGEVGQLLQLSAALVLVFDEHEVSVHFGAHRRAKLEAGGGLLSCVLE